MVLGGEVGSTASKPIQQLTSALIIPSMVQCHPVLPRLYMISPHITSHSPSFFLTFGVVAVWVKERYSSYLYRLGIMLSGNGMCGNSVALLPDFLPTSWLVCKGYHFCSTAHLEHHHSNTNHTAINIPLLLLNKQWIYNCYTTGWGCGKFSSTTPLTILPIIYQYC